MLKRGRERKCYARKGVDSGEPAKKRRKERLGQRKAPEKKTWGPLDKT